MRWWIVILSLAAGMAATLAAQRPGVVRGGLPEPPQVFSGADLGFRVDGVDSAGHPTGTFVIRQNNRWVPVSPAPAR